MTEPTGSAGAGNPGGTPAGQDATDWTTGLGPELAPLVQAKGWKAPADALKSYAELERLVGQNRLAIPGKDARPEEWDKVWTTLGKPEKPEGYSFKKPENLAIYDDDFAGWFRGAAHKRGLPDQLATAIHDEYVGWVVEQSKKDADAIKAARAAGMGELQKEWGAKFEANKAMALEAVALAGDPSLKDWFDKSGLGDDPRAIKLFAGIGAKLQEAGVKGSGAGNFGVSKETALAEIRQVRADPKHAYHVATHPEHTAALARMETLYKIAYPDGAA